MTNRFILSTVGISLFLNVLYPDEQDHWRTLLNRSSNDKELDGEIERKIKSLGQRVEKILEEGGVDRLRKISPELNGLFGIDGKLGTERNDMHYLISTDTAMGLSAAHILKSYLENQGLQVNIFTPSGLNTKSPFSFSKGMKDLLKWCEDTIPGYRESKYEIIFNLTAAFKSLQGYLNIIGMFYADRMVYIFEGSRELMSIPRLPIYVDEKNIVANALNIALLASGAVLEKDGIGDIPEGLIDEDENGDVVLSDWGFLIWNRIKKDILTEKLLEFPNLAYDASFEKDFQRASNEQRVKLQETLADVSSILLDKDGNGGRLARGGLQYTNYKNTQTAEGRPIGHFRTTLNNRVSCVREGKTLRLRHFGEHDYVNDNP